MILIREAMQLTVEQFSMPKLPHRLLEVLISHSSMQTLKKRWPSPPWVQLRLQGFQKRYMIPMMNNNSPPFQHRDNNIKDLLEIL